MGLLVIVTNLLVHVCLQPATGKVNQRAQVPFSEILPKRNALIKSHLYKSHTTHYNFQVCHHVQIFCITRENYDGTSRHFTSKPRENQTPHCYVLAI